MAPCKACKAPATRAILRQLDLIYGTGNQRIMQQMLNGSSLTTKYYVGGDYEVEDKDREITRVHYIYAPSGLAAIVRRDAQNNDAINFVLNDHLGSVQVLANATGQLLEEFSYDPWGLRRDPITLDVYAWAQMPVTDMEYGFTGHEHLDIFMLVNMNGRMYDPVVGRFLTPDPVLQFPNYTQGLNPYAYALNNPLRFVDPDGYSLVGQLIAVGAQIALTSVGLPMLGVLAYSVIMTVDYAIEQGRNVKAGEIYGYFMQTFVMSTISMGVTQGIGDYFKAVKNTNLLELRRALAHGTFNGTMRFAQGGKFEHGFMSGFVSSLGGTAINNPNMSVGARVALSAVIGGTAEKLGGGKFANGAVTGAYVMMFNHLATQLQEQKQAGIWDDFPVTDYTSLNNNERAEHIFNALKYANEHGMDGIVPLDKIFSNLKNSKTLQHAGIKINSAFVSLGGEDYRVQIIIPLYNSIKAGKFLGSEVQLKGGHYAKPFNNGWYRNYNNTYQIAVFGQERYNSLMKWLKD